MACAIIQCIVQLIGVRAYARPSAVSVVFSLSYSVLVFIQPFQVELCSIVEFSFSSLTEKRPQLMAHSKSPSRPSGDGTSDWSEIAKRISQGLGDFNSQYRDAQLRLHPRNPVDTDSKYFIYRLGFQALHDVSEMEAFIHRYLGDFKCATRLIHEQLGGEGRIIVFFDVYKGDNPKEKLNSASWPWSWIMVCLVFAFLAYSFRGMARDAWE